MEAEFEYGVMRDRDELNDPFLPPHREKMTEEEARTWVQECEEMGFRPGMFKVIRRPVGPWEEA